MRIIKGVVSKYEEHHKITYKTEALVGAVKLAQRYLSERNLPDVALDIIDEAGSEYSVKEEVAKAKIPELEKQIPEIEKMLKDLEGKDPVKNAAEFEKLADTYDRFARDFELLEDSWGHRLDIPAGGEK